MGVWRRRPLQNQAFSPKFTLCHRLESVNAKNVVRARLSLKGSALVFYKPYKGIACRLTSRPPCATLHTP
jgi:hypothetical protein